MYRPAAGLWRDLYEPLLDTGVHPLRYVLRAWPRAMWPTFAVALVLTLLCQLLGLDPFSGEDPRRLLGSEPNGSEPKGRLLLKVVLFAPLAETLLMAPMLALLMRLWGGRRLPAALSSAAAWAFLHSLSALLWGLCVFWTFLVFSTAWLAWRPRSFGHAFLVTAAIHALHNAVAGLALILAW